MESILNYLNMKYHPIGILVYGSFANGTNLAHSDFDVMLLYHGDEVLHDDCIIEGVQLDAFVYPLSYFSDFNFADFIRVRDGLIIKDDDGFLTKLKANVAAYIANLPRKTEAENLQNLSWCKKMLLRIQLGNLDSIYRKYWLLIDSLEIYFDVMGEFYPGPKKALRMLESRFPEALQIYRNALENPSYDTLNIWIGYIEEQMKKASL